MYNSAKRNKLCVLTDWCA